MGDIADISLTVQKIKSEPHTYIRNQVKKMFGKKGKRFYEIEARDEYFQWLGYNHGFISDETLDKWNQTSKEQDQRLKVILRLGAHKLCKWHLGVRFDGRRKNGIIKCRCESTATITQDHILTCSLFEETIKKFVLSSHETGALKLLTEGLQDSNLKPDQTHYWSLTNIIEEEKTLSQEIRMILDGKGKECRFAPD